MFTKSRFPANDANEEGITLNDFSGKWDRCLDDPKFPQTTSKTRHIYFDKPDFTAPSSF
jgi:hypothetical protein